jgi:hypothetical protein
MPDVFSSIVRSLLIAPLLVFAIIPLGHSQDQAVVARRLTFDTASIKPSSTNRPWPTVSAIKNGRVAAKNVTAKLLVTIAFKVDGFAVSGGPKCLDSDQFDLEAKAVTSLALGANSRNVTVRSA